MKIITKEFVNPNMLTNIDCKSNIVMSVHPNENNLIQELENFPDRFQLKLTRNINLSTNDIVRVSPSILSTQIRSSLKLSLPIGVMPMFQEFTIEHAQNVFYKIYKSCREYGVYREDEDSGIIDHIIMDDIQFILYVDTVRIRDVGLHMVLKKDMPFTDFFFAYYIQTKNEMIPIEDIYLFIDEQVNKDFSNIF